MKEGFERFPRGLKEMRKIVASSIPRAFGLVWKAGPALTAVILVITFLEAFFPVAILWTTKLTIDRIAILMHEGVGAGDKGLRPLWILIGILGVLWVVNRGMESLRNTMTGLLRFKVENHVQSLIMQKCSTLDLAFFENPKNLDILENASRGALMSAFTMVQMLFSLTRTFVTLGTFLTALFHLHWLTMTVVAFTTAPQMLSSSYFARRHWKMKTGQAEESRLRYYLSWLITQRETAKEVRSFGLSGYLLDRFKYFSQKFFKQERALEIRRETANLFLGLLGIAGTVGIWVYVALRAIGRTLTMGDVVFYTQAVQNCQGNLLSLFTQGGQLYEQTLFLGNLFALLDMKPAEIEGALRGPDGCPRRWGDRVPPIRIKNGIEFRDVSFRYPGSKNWVLRNVSFMMRPGESIALVGRNGAGKTTLVKLLARLYDPTEGEIWLDGHNLREFDLDLLRQGFGTIFQDYTRYFLTLRENIGFGDVQWVEDVPRVKKASGKAEAEEIAKRLPGGYETYLGRQFTGLGVDLSGGEWQKVALARAYMRDSPILILDEPTAALDAFAEYEIYKGFAEMTGGKIVVFISHRFSTVRMANHILVLKDGEVIEEGSHDALLTLDGLYASMFKTQADRYQ